MTGAAAEFDAIERWFFEEGEAASLRRLADIALRYMRADAASMIDAGIALLEGDEARARRHQAEATRLRMMLDVATPPGAMRAAPIAPARGAMQRVDDPAGPYWRGMDQLSVMCRQARARHRGNAPFVAPFTPGQIQMARHYQTLVDSHDASGMKCASIEAKAGGGGGGQGGFIEALLNARQEITTLQRRIGDGIALQVQRGGAGSGRHPITVRSLVDAVCLYDQDLTSILRAHGWDKSSSRLQALRLVLAEALDRMQGLKNRTP